MGRDNGSEQGPLASSRLTAQAQAIGQGRGHEDQQVAGPSQGVPGGDHALGTQGGNADSRNDKTSRNHLRGYSGQPSLGNDARQANEDDQSGKEEKGRDPAGNNPISTARIP